jgi:hypothetical protein
MEKGRDDVSRESVEKCHAFIMCDVMSRELV